MIPAGVEIYVALEPVGMRLSFDRLAGLAKEQVGYDARSGALFLSSASDALKVLFFDGSGIRRHRSRPERDEPIQHPSTGRAGATRVVFAASPRVDVRDRSRTHCRSRALEGGAPARPTTLTWATTSVPRGTKVAASTRGRGPYDRDRRRRAVSAGQVPPFSLLSSVDRDSRSGDL
jgi:transposase